MKVLVTGAGLVGCHAARELTNRGHSVMVYDLAPDDAYIHSVAGDVSTVRGDVRDLPALALMRCGSTARRWSSTAPP